MADVFHSHGQEVIHFLESNKGQAIDTQHLFSSFTLASFSGMHPLLTTQPCALATRVQEVDSMVIQRLPSAKTSTHAAPIANLHRHSMRRLVPPTSAFSSLSLAYARSPPPTPLAHCCPSTCPSFPTSAGFSVHSVYAPNSSVHSDLTSIQVLNPAVNEIVRRRKEDPRRAEKEDLLSLCMPPRPRRLVSQDALQIPA